MASILLDGQRTWSLVRDAEGHRTYKLKLRAVTNTPYDGPAIVSNTPGLPLPGAFWVVDNDVDLWAYCQPEASVTPVLGEDDGPNFYWDLEFTFSTKPPDTTKQRCNDFQIEDPLLEPQKISGTFVNYVEEAQFDKNGSLILSSAGEPYRGPGVEFDAGRLTIHIEQNVPFLQLPLVASMYQTLNNAPLWGLPARCIKLSNFSFERLFFGACFLYYRRIFDFDIRFDTFDRVLLDEGNLIKRGRWVTDPDDPDYGGYIVDPGADLDPSAVKRAVDLYDNPIRAILDGTGAPINKFNPTPGQILVQKYQESNFLLLGIPTAF